MNLKPKIILSDLAFDKREERAVISVLRSRWLSMGPVCQKFEQKFSAAIGVDYALAVANCTAALHLALTALGVKKGDEVIVPSYTFIASVNVISYVGATPVFADIESLDDFTISIVDIKKKLTKRTKAIIVVHYAGFPCDMSAIMKIAKDHKLFVIEDAAHGPGSFYKGRQIGAIGDVGCFSFFANKNMATGEGGMVVTNHKDVAERLKYLRSHGMTSFSWDRCQGHAHSYDVVALGYNYRFDEIRAALGIVQLSKLKENTRKRKMLYDNYLKLLKGIKGVKIPFLTRQQKVSYHIFPILLESKVLRDRLQAYLVLNNIQSSIHYPPAHLMEIYRKPKKWVLPVTEAVAQRQLTLPLHSGLRLTDIERIVKVIRNFSLKENNSKT